MIRRCQNVVNVVMLSLRCYRFNLNTIPEYYITLLHYITIFKGA